MLVLVQLASSLNISWLGGMSCACRVRGVTEGVRCHEELWFAGAGWRRMVSDGRWLNPYGLELGKACRKRVGGYRLCYAISERRGLSEESPRDRCCVVS